MRGGVLLDRRTGKPVERQIEPVEAMLKAPPHILELLERANQKGRPLKEMPLAGRNSWEEMVKATVANGTTNTSAVETLAIADADNYFFPAGILRAGTVIKVSARGILTTDASAATLLFRLRAGISGSVLTGTALAAQTTAQAPSNSQTNASWHFESMSTIQQDPGTAVPVMTHAFASYPGQAKLLIPLTGNVTVNLNTTVSVAFGLTYTFAAAESITTQQYIVEWLG